MTVNPDQIKSQMKDQIAVLDEAITSVRQGRLQDISGLDGAVELICRDIGTLDENLAASFEESMAEMIGRLESLAEELKIFVDQATNEPDQV